MSGNTTSVLNADSPLSSHLIAVREAFARIQKKTRRTPLKHSGAISRHLSSIVGRPVKVYLKCENLQRGGSFKVRGAMNAVGVLSENGKLDIKVGVCTTSSGNHSQALSIAGREYGVPVTVVMPETAPIVKVKATRDEYGATVVHCGKEAKDRDRVLNELQNSTPDGIGVYVPPFDAIEIVHGAGTVALEVYEGIDGVGDAPTLFCAPIGGGGLTSGCSIVHKSVSNPEGSVFWGAEPSLGGDAFESVKTGVLQSAWPARSICDGLLTSLSPLTLKGMLARFQQVEVAIYEYYTPHVRRREREDGVSKRKNNYQGSTATPSHFHPQHLSLPYHIFGIL